jgi:hypothetical protein
MALAIGVNAIAFRLWNISLRSPLEVTRDILASLRAPRRLVGGAIRFLGGLALLAMSLTAVAAYCSSVRDVGILETWMLLSGLAVTVLLAERQTSASR